MIYVMIWLDIFFLLLLLPLRQIANALRQQQCAAMSTGSANTPTPLTFLTEDEKMMKETGKLSIKLKANFLGR